MRTFRFGHLPFVAVFLLALVPGAHAGTLADVTPGAWTQLNNTKVESVSACPTDSCAYSGGGFSNIMAAWGGGAFDTIQNRLLIWGGGHLDYFGNDVYGFDLDTGAWELVIAPSNYTATAAHATAGMYPDGRPTARHTYNHLVFVESQNAFMATGAYAISPVSGAADGRFWKLDFDSVPLNWSQGASAGSNGIVVGYSAYNRVTDTVYYHHSIDGRFYKYTPGSDSHTYLTSKALQIYGTAAVDTSRNKMLVVGGYSTAQAFVWDLNPGTPTARNLVSGTPFASADGLALANDDAIGLDYDPVNDKFVAWKGGRSVYVIDAETYAVSRVTPTGDDPGPELASGTYGRFRYAPSINAFVLANGVDRDVFVFQLENMGANPPPLITLSASSTSVVAGDGVTLSWNVSNADTCVASDSWSGSRALSGSEAFVNLTVDQSYTLTCTGDGGTRANTVAVTVTDDVPPPPPPPPPPGGSDWDARSTAPGVLSAIGFDSEDEVSNWTHLDSRQDNVVWETGNTSSGTGALRFNVLKTDGANSGNWRRWLSDDEREFYEGDEFYVSFRQYFPEYYATHVFLDGGGWKQIIVSRNAGDMNGVNYVGTPTGSNQVNEIVMNNYLYRSLPQGYARSSNGSYVGFNVGASTACSSTDFRYQNAVDRGPQFVGTACENDRARYGGLYSYGARTGVPDPLTGAFTYAPDEWHTFKMWIKLGSQGTSTRNTHVKIWAAHDGEDWDLIMDRDDIDLGGGPAHNALWLLPYDTGRSPDPTREDTYTLYDEVIVSLNDIAAPGASSGSGMLTPTVNLTASSGSILAGGSVQLDWSTTVADSCVASGGWSGSKPTSGSETVGPLSASTTFLLTCANDQGSSTDSVTVVVEAPPAPLPALRFSAEPKTASYNGFTNLNWSATNVDSCTAAGDWAGARTLSGEQLVGPLTTTSTYTLTCAGSNGTVSETLVVQVLGDETPPTLELDMSVSNLGLDGTVALIWSSNNASSCVASGSWSGSRAANGVETGGPVSGSETYVLTCTGSGGTVSDSISVSLIDSDLDGMPDIWEEDTFGTLSNDAAADFDGDGVPNSDEYQNGTDPQNVDTDNDGASDFDELQFGTDPLDPTSTTVGASPARPGISARGTASLTAFAIDTADAYSDPDGHALNYSLWQIALAGEFDNLIFERQVFGSTGLIVPTGVLDPGVVYYFRTRHVDSSNMPSPWSVHAIITAESFYPNDVDGNNINDTYQVPGNPDTNNNGVPDQDEGICNLYDAEGGNIIGITSDIGVTRCYTSVPMGAIDTSALPADGEMPLGMFAFRIEGLIADAQNPAEVFVDLWLPDAYDTASGWWQWDSVTSSLSDITDAVVYNGNRATLRLVDGGVGDQDGVVNGVIIDPSGPLITAVAQLPPPPPPPDPPALPPTTSAPPPADGSGSSGGGGALHWIVVMMLVTVLRRRHRR